MPQASTQPALDRPCVVLLTLGGAVTSTGGSRHLHSTADGAALVAPLPAHAEGQVLVLPRTVRQVPSTFLTFEDIAELADEVDRHRREGAQGIVVAAGADTLEEVAFGLDLLLDADTPVVLTAALRPAGHAAADGIPNLVAAAQVAAHPQARGRGALVVAEETIHAARFLRRAWTMVGGGALPALISAPGGPLGWVAEGVPTFVSTVPPLLTLPRAWVEPSARVAVVEAGLDVDGALVDAAVHSGFSGIVVAAMGGGHVTPAMAESLASAASRVPVVLTSRAMGGPILRRSYGFAGSETDLLGRGVLWGGWLSPVQARVALTLLLRGGEERRSISTWFQRMAG